MKSVYDYLTEKRVSNTTLHDNKKLLDAVKSGNHEEVKKLLDEGYSASKEDNIIPMALKHDDDLAILLIQHKVEIDPEELGVYLDDDGDHDLATKIIDALESYGYSKEDINTVEEQLSTYMQVAVDPDKYLDKGMKEYFVDYVKIIDKPNNNFYWVSIENQYFFDNMYQSVYSKYLPNILKGCGANNDFYTTVDYLSEDNIELLYKVAVKHGFDGKDPKGEWDKPLFEFAKKNIEGLDEEFSTFFDEAETNGFKKAFEESLGGFHGEYDEDTRRIKLLVSKEDIINSIVYSSGDSFIEIEGFTIDDVEYNEEFNEKVTEYLEKLLK